MSSDSVCNSSHTTVTHADSYSVGARNIGTVDPQNLQAVLKDQFDGTEELPCEEYVHLLIFSRLQSRLSNPTVPGPGREQRFHTGRGGMEALALSLEATVQLQPTIWLRRHPKLR